APEPECVRLLLPLAELLAPQQQAVTELAKRLVAGLRGRERGHVSALAAQTAVVGEGAADRVARPRRTSA
ncbi:MAG: hypothetical protein L0H75_03695, partial [Nitrosospira sp.]|nr:hypothetical protein [Nitrosospira sp.]